MPARLSRPAALTALALTGLLALSALPAMAQASTTAQVLHGVRYEPGVEVGGQKLLLNGAGTRYKAVFKVYTAGLYLEQPARSLQEVAALPGPKRMSVTMLRDIDSSELGKLFSRGMEDNMERSAFSKLVPGVLRMSQIFTEHKRLLAGETFLVDWIPGHGTQITVKGRPQGEPFKEPEFFMALLGIWLGPHPADEQLKKTLLGSE
ncbi:hypothetical protein GCM10010975_23600 [Comamonas phosphati]|nr:hypothetical protein GCM10010975_23600 [Comamonas phosphati]